MRVSALIVVVVMLGLAGRADAEKVKTNQSTKLYARPGEAGKVLLKVKSGQTMTVVAKEGRWLKVRVQGRTGYVPRSKVDLPDDDGEVGRNTRSRPFVGGRGTKRGPGGEGPDDRVGADAVGDGEEGDGKNGKDADEGEGHNKPPKKHIKKDRDPDEDGEEKTPPKKPHKKGDKGDKADKGDKGEDGDEEVVDAGDGDKGEEAEKDTRPKSHVTADSVKIYNEPDKTSGTAFTAGPDMMLYVEDKKGKWTQVSVEDGDIGWVLTSKLDIDEGGGGESSITGRTIDLRARGGLTILNQGLRSAGSTLPPGVPDNYNVGTAAATLALGADILYPYGKNYVLGGELAYDYDRAVPGVAFMGKNIGITVHNLNLRALAGYDLHNSKGMIVYGRLGYHYQGFLVDNVSDLTQNTAKIPSEVFSGITVGGALSIPKLTPTIGIRASLDIAAVGTSLTQTKNLEDGLSPSEKAVCLGGVFTYRWKPKMDLQATYDLNYGSVSFGAPVTGSMRGHTGTSVSRTDIFHTLSFGITYAL